MGTIYPWQPSEPGLPTEPWLPSKPPEGTPDFTILPSEPLETELRIPPEPSEEEKLYLDQLRPIADDLTLNMGEVEGRFNEIRNEHIAKGASPEELETFDRCVKNMLTEAYMKRIVPPR